MGGNAIHVSEKIRIQKGTMVVSITEVTMVSWIIYWTPIFVDSWLSRSTKFKVHLRIYENNFYWKSSCPGINVSFKHCVFEKIHKKWCQWKLMIP